MEAFFAEPKRFAACLSPDGQRVAYLGPDATETNRLWVASTEQSQIPCRVSSPTGPAVLAFFWIGNDSILWQTRDSSNRAHLFMGDPQAADSREILQDERRFITLEGVASSITPSLLVGLSDGPTAFPDLYRVALVGNQTPTRVCENHHRIIVWAWDQTGTPVAGLRWTPDGAKEIVNLRDDSGSVAFHVAPADDLRLLFAVSDGSRVLIITNKDSDLTYLASIELATGGLRKIASDPLGRVDVDQVVADPATGKVLAVGYADAKLRWQAMDPMVGDMLKTVEEATDSRNVNWLGTTTDNTRILLKRSADQDPGTVQCYEVASRKLRTLWQERPPIDRALLCATRSFDYPARDGSIIPSLLTIPQFGCPPWPLVVFPHGGPRMRNHPGFDGRVQFLASRGYAVFQPEFRGSRGYGKAFMHAGDGQWGRGVMQTDVTDGLAHLIQSGKADPRRVAILGGSYGGYAALAGLAFTPDCYAAGICLFGISDLLAYATDSPVEWEAYAGDKVRCVGDPLSVAGREQLQHCSPVHHADLFKAPLLIYHGAEDPLLPVSHARRMVAALERHAKPVDFLLANDEGHGFSQPVSEMAVYRAIEIFLHTHLGGQLGPSPSAAVTRKLTRFQQSGAADASQ